MKLDRVILLLLVYLLVGQPVINFLVWEDFSYLYLGLVNLGVVLLFFAFDYFLSLKKNNVFEEEIKLEVEEIQEIQMPDGTEVIEKIEETEEVIVNNEKNSNNKKNVIKSFFSRYGIFVFNLFFSVLLFLGLYFNNLDLFLISEIGLLIVLLFYMKIYKSQNYYIGKKLYLPKDESFFVSILFFAMFYFFVSKFVEVEAIKFFVGILAGFVSYLFSIKFFDAVPTLGLKKLFTYKMWFWLLVFSFIFSVVEIFFVEGEFAKSLDKFKLALSGYKVKVERMWQQEEQKTKKLLQNSGVEKIGNLNTGNFVTGSLITGNVLQNTGNIITGEQKQELSPAEEFKLELQKKYAQNPITYADAIKYLVLSNNIEIPNTKDVKFWYIPYSNEYYPFFKVAYDKKLIGTKIKPDSLVKCDNYVVMKGLLQNWKVDETKDIFTRYFEKAEELGKLNNCKLGNYLKVENL